MSEDPNIALHEGKWFHITVLSFSAFLAMGLWFSASAVVPQLSAEWSLSESQKAWMTLSVQIGFVIGALLSAVLNLADRYSVRRLFTVSTILAALFNAAIPAFNPGPESAILLRFLTGFAIAGVYPPGMKLMATWCQKDLGFGIGILVGALSVGSALPHLLSAFPFLGEGGIPAWRSVLYFSSGLALIGAALAGFVLKAGPYLRESAPFDWQFVGRALSHQPTRLANFGYLGHMWELYAMWTWLPVFIILSYKSAGLSEQSARVMGFSVIAVGLISCTLAGKFADKIGRTKVSSWSMIISGVCSLIIGFFFHDPVIVSIIGLIWGFFVISDSAQFSAAVSELTDSRYVGTALALQTSMGFLLTMVSIRLIPILAEQIGWDHVFMVLAIGPVLGTWSMLKLRTLPESTRMASGNR